MRRSLEQSFAHTPVKGFEKYQKGSIILCNACALPIFKLDRSINAADKGGQSASAFVPLSLADLDVLAQREDIDAGVRATVRGMSVEMRIGLISKLRQMHSGDPMMCPVCQDCFVQVVAVDKQEVLDRAFTVELLAIPPEGAGRPAPVRGKRLGTNGEWLN